MRHWNFSSELSQLFDFLYIIYFIIDILVIIQNYSCLLEKEIADEVND